MNDIVISGFADEISADFAQQLEAVRQMGMNYISLRCADHKNIAEYTPAQVQESLLPRLKQAKVGVSSLGSPIGKIPVEDDAAFEAQKQQLHSLCQICKLLGCQYIRVFSFYIPAQARPETYTAQVVQKLKQLVEIAAQYNVVLIHENEKDIYGDVSLRCREILDAVNSPYFQCVFDFANFVQCGENTLECWQRLKDRVVYIHIKDAVSTDKENVLCGTGEGNISQLLQQAICSEGYKGFLTLEPHLVLFESLQSLEIADAGQVIKQNKYKNGRQGYEAQYRALLGILEQIGVPV